MSTPNNSIPPPPLRTISFELTRNQLVDMQRALKDMVKAYDDPSKNGRYIVTNLMGNKSFIVQIGVDRAKDPNHPLHKRILADMKLLNQKVNENVENVQKVPGGSQG